MKRWISLLIFSFPFVSFTLEFDTIRKELAKGQIHSVEDLLATLPAPFLSRFILIYKSRSLQGATPQEPRVVLYDTTGLFTLTFNGSTSQKGGHHIEILERGTGANSGDFYSIDFENGDPIVETNPPRCFTCHTSFGHPLFDPHDLWPGIYGSYGGDDGNLLKKEEITQLRQFFETKDTHSRYRNLNFSATGSDYKTFVDRNTEFTQLLYRNQAIQLASFMIKASRNTIPLQAWLEPQPGMAFTRHLPPTLQARAEADYENALHTICKRVLSNTVRRLKSQLSLTPAAKGTYVVSDLTALDGIARAYALASSLGLLDDFKELSSLTVDRESYVSNDGAHGFWSYFYEKLGGGDFPKEILKGTPANLVYSGTSFFLSTPHPVCGSLRYSFLH